MTFDDLIQFLETRMTMSHIYQPLLIRSLVDAGGAATLHQLATDFVVQDESQLLFYEKRIKDMPLRVLTKHGVVQKHGELVSLSTPRLTFEQRARVKMLCEQKLQQFIQQRGLGLWDYRLLDDDPVPDNLRYQVLKAGGGRCALCGATKEERPLDVDHILPRSRGGKNTLANLQILCAKCNRTKGNKDTEDYRANLEASFNPACAYCNIGSSNAVIEETALALVARDEQSGPPGRVRVLPKRHTPDFFTMTADERREADDLLRVYRSEVQHANPAVLGFRVSTDSGQVDGQVSAHAVICLTPCYGD